MANINKFIPLLFQWEGGYVNDPADSGGPTHQGVTLKTWQAYGCDKNGDGIIDEADLKRIRQEEIVEYILRPHYWNRWRADEIQSQSIANILVDWVWCSGTPGIKIPQNVLKVKTDGIVGKETLGALNNHPNPEGLFARLKSERIAYTERICKARPANNRFKKGWLNRIASFRFFAVSILCLIFFCWGGCKSIPQQKRVETSVKTTENTAKKIDSTVYHQLEQLVINRLEQGSEEENVTETIVINYDTSLPKDTATGNHPIKSVSKTVANKNLKVNTSANEVKETNVQQAARLTDKSKTTVLRKEESLQTKQPGKDPYRWRYMVVAIIVLAVGFLLFRWKAGR